MSFRPIMTISSREKPLFQKNNSLMTPFVLSCTSDNTTSQNIRGTNAWAFPHLTFWGTVLRVSLCLRPCIYVSYNFENLGRFTYPCDERMSEIFRQIQHDKSYRCPAARGPCSSGARANGPFGPWVRRDCS